MSDNTYLVPLLSVVLGGMGAKLLDHIFGARKTSSDISLAEKKHDIETSAEIRNELRGEAKRERDARREEEADAAKNEDRLRTMLKTAEDETGRLRAIVNERHAQPVSLLQVQGYLREIESLRDQVSALQHTNDTLTMRLRTQQK